MNEGYGIISCIPIVIMLGLVFTTKRLFESILLSIMVALMISDGITGFVFTFIDQVYSMLADETYTWILVMLLLFGALIKLLEESGGTLGFGDIASKYIKSEKDSLMATYILGILIFIDDYLNNLTIGAAMRGITDKYKVPREMTALTINTTGGPVCVLFPFSTWAVFIVGLMQTNGIGVGGTVISEYVKVIPYVFYAIVSIIMVPLLIMGIIPKFGPLKKAYERAKAPNGSVLPHDLAMKQAATHAVDDAIAESSAGVDTERERILSKVTPKTRDFLIPILIVIGITIYTGDLIFGVMAGIAVCFLLYIPTKNMTIPEFFDNFFEGIKDMAFIAVFIMMAFIFVEAVNHLGFSNYVIEAAKPYLIGGLIPVLSFILIGALAFFGIDFWGIMVLTFPIFIPLSQHFDINVYLTIGAIVSGAVFGGQACFFSEQMLMSSTSVQIRPTDQAVCLLPYALLACGVSAVMYLIFGFVL